MQKQENKPKIILRKKFTSKILAGTFCSRDFKENLGVLMKRMEKEEEESCFNVCYHPTKDKLFVSKLVKGSRDSVMDGPTGRVDEDGLSFDESSVNINFAKHGELIEGLPILAHIHAHPVGDSIPSTADLENIAKTQDDNKTPVDSNKNTLFDCRRDPIKSELSRVGISEFDELYDDIKYVLPPIAMILSGNGQRYELGIYQPKTEIDCNEISNESDYATMVSSRNRELYRQHMGYLGVKNTNISLKREDIRGSVFRRILESKLKKFEFTAYAELCCSDFSPDEDLSRHKN